MEAGNKEPREQGNRTRTAVSGAAYREAMQLALEIADENAPEELESELLHADPPDEEWWDLSTLDETIGFERRVRYCALRGLMQHHPEKANLVQFLEP